MEIQQPALIATSPMRAGLGNRLRLVLSSQVIADAEQRNFYYHWPVGAENGKQFGAHFTELWEYTGGTPLNEPGPEPVIEFSQFGMGDLATVRDAPVISVRGNTLVPGFGDQRWWGHVLAEMRPTEEVLARTASPLEQLGDSFIGVQVRAHPTLTHKKTLEQSPVSWFIDRMNQLREDNPGISFFLSCDHAEAQAEIASAIPGVVALRKSGEYNSRQALIESVADLVVLSRSKRILEPFASTFAKIAWLMARRSMPIENSVKTQPAARP